MKSGDDLAKKAVKEGFSKPSAGKKIELELPIIGTEWEKFKTAITTHAKDELDAFEEYSLRQAFYAGFAKGVRLGNATFTPEEGREEVMAEVMDELEWISAQARDLGKKTGRGTVNSKDFD